MAESIELQVSYLPQIYAKWRIENFFDLPDADDYTLRSPCLSLCGGKWFLILYTNGDRAYGHWIGLYLMKENPTDQTFAYKFGIQKADGSELISLEEEDTYEKRKRWGTFKLIKRQDLLTSQGVVDADGTLTVFCIVRIMGGPLAWPTVEATSQTPSNGIPTLIENFKDMYLSKNFADVTITINDRKFFAHKNVLTCRSTVFSSMFNSDMTEKVSGKIEITDCDQDTFEAFLLFLYTGKLDMVTPSSAPYLYNTADKYDVQELKTECISCMMNKLTIDSFCDVLRLAMIYNETDLLNAATAFFIENAKQILVTLKWQNFSAENPSLGNELFLKFVHKYT